MDPANQKLPEQSSPVNNTQTPLATVPIPKNTSNSGMPKSVRTTGTVSLVMGILMVLLGLGLGIFYDISFLINVVLGVVYIMFGVKLRNVNSSTSQVLFAIRVLGSTVVVNLILGLFTHDGPGLLPLLLIFFLIKSMRELFKAGLTTSIAPLKAKPKS